VNEVSNSQRTRVENVCIHWSTDIGERTK